MIDLAIDECHDLAMPSNDLALVYDRLEVLQSVHVRIKFIKFEWAFDFTLGVPWLDGMFDVQVSQIQKEKVLRDTIIQTLGVSTVNEFLFNTDRVKRGALVTFRGETIYGPIEGEIL
jgi:hypothetical protein